MSTLKEYIEQVYLGDGWWDISSHWNKLEKLAKQRDDQKSKYKSTKNWSAGNSTHFLGLISEFCFTLETGIMFDKSLLPKGDLGHDFKHLEKTYDVKGTKYFHEPHLKQYPKPKTWVDYYLLAGIDVSNQKVKIFGWASKEEIQAAPLHDYGYGPQRAIKYADLHKGMPTWLPSTRSRLAENPSI